jgi:hypothetical protein
MTEQEERVALHIKKAATMPRMIRSRHNPRTSHLDMPAKPQMASSAATTARISIDTAHDNILSSLGGLKACHETMNELNASESVA